MDAAVSSPTEGFLDGKGGLKIFYRRWLPEGAPRAVVAICHGVNSHSGYYLWAAEQFVKQGYAVYALDLRGRGKSEGERYYVETVDEYAGDLDLLIDLAASERPGLQIFLLGHSAGGVTSCIYALDHADKIAGLICESFAFRVPAPDFALTVLKGLSHILPHTHVLKLKKEDFSRDPAVTAAMLADPLTDKEVQPVQTVAALVRADERIEAEFGNFAVPLFIVHGTGDKVTRMEGSQMFYDNAGSADKTLKLYDGYWHDMLNDVGKEAVMTDIIDWIGSRVSPTA